MQKTPMKTPKSSLKPVKKRNTEERRELIRQRVESNGPWNVNRLELSKELGVDYKTIQNDWKIVLDQIPSEDLKETELHLSKVYKDALDRMHTDLIHGEDVKERAAAAKAIATLGQTFTGHLEAYGRKNPIIQQVEVSGGLDIKFNLPKEFLELKKNGQQTNTS